MSTLRAVTELCIHSFAAICHEIDQAAHLETSVCDEIREERGRFRVWTGNLGALAKGHSALDWRLRDADVMRSTLLSLLEELQNTLELASTLIRGESSEVFLGAEALDTEHVPDDISLPSDDGLDAITQSEHGLSQFSRIIQDLIKDLYKLSFRIRNSTSKPARAIYYKEIETSSGLDLFGDCFAALDTNHVFELFRSLRHSHRPLTEDDDILVRRFAKANTSRRRQFRYWQKHAQKLAITDVPEPVVPKTTTLQLGNGFPTIQTPPKPLTNTQKSQSHQGKTIFTTTEATFFDPKPDMTPLETQSVISSATTSRDLEGNPADLPPPPAAVSNGQDFVCPYCFVLCPSTHGHGRAWRKHILQDLQPYSCTYTNCSSADRLYGSRREWLEHEESQHRKIWVCHFHPSTGFSNQDDFEEHLRQQGHVIATEAQIKEFASIAQSTAEDLRQQCPICSEDAARIPLFPAHLAHHLERIATFSISRGLDDEASASFASFRADSQSMSDRISVNSDLSTLSWEDLAPSSQRESNEQDSLKDDILEWFREMSDCDLGPPERPDSTLDPALLQALKQSPEYTSWFNGIEPGRLICRAEAKIRRTAFLSAVYRDLESSNRPQDPVIYAFLRNEHIDTLTFTRLMANLIAQLLSQTSAISNELLDIYQTRSSPSEAPTFEVLHNLVHSLINSAPRVFMILDDSTQHNGILTGLLNRVISSAHLRLLISSSHKSVCSLCKRNVVTHWRCKECSGGRFQLCTECKNSGRGCFEANHRLLKFQEGQTTIDLDALYTLDHRKRSLSRAMNSKIVEIQTEYHNDEQRQSLLIEEAFERIMSFTLKGSEHEDLAMAAFDVIQHAFSPLKDFQFKTAVCNILRTRQPHSLTYPTITDVIEATGGLLIVQQGSVIACFHHSLSVYLERSKSRWFPSGHAGMALACLTVLTTQAMPTSPDEDWDWARNSFFGYAACSWGRHLRACSATQSLEDMALKYLENDEQLRTGIAVAYALRPEDLTYGFDIGRGLTAAHVCSIFGLTNLLQRLPHAQLSGRTLFTGRTPLLYACKLGHLDTVEFLLDIPAKSFPRNAGDMIPDAGLSPALIEASTYGHGKVVQLLLERGADVDAKDQTVKGYGVSPLISASSMGHIDIVRLLLDHGAAVDHKDPGAEISRETPLISASRQGFADIVRLLLKSGADPNADDLGGRTGFHATRRQTPLAYACEWNHIDVAKLLLEYGADPNVENLRWSIDLENFRGQPPLAYACRMGRVDMVKLLLGYGARPDLDYGAQFSDNHEIGFTVLHEAIKSRQTPIVEVLLRSSSVKLTPITSRENDTVSLLMSLLQLGSLDVLKLALSWDDLDINEKDHNGRTVVWWLLRASHDRYDSDFQGEALRLIVQHPKCDVNAVDLGGRTYVMRFLDVRILNIKLLRILLENGADVNRVDEDGETAIFHAVTIRYSLEITSLLIKHGADLAIRNRWGQGLTHRLVADIEASQDLEYLDLLLKHMPTLIDARDGRGRTPLHLALVYGKTQLAKELLARAADIDSLDKFGRAPFDVACQYGRVGILSKLNPVGIHKILPDAWPKPSDIASRVPHEAHAVAPLDAHFSGRPDKRLSWDNTKHGEEEFGHARLEMQLVNLPAWSLGYQGRFDKLLASLNLDRVDPLEQSPDDGNTALHTVIRSTIEQTQWVFAQKERVFQLMLRKVRHNCSPQNECQETPLHTALLASQTKMAIWLIEAGADLSLRDNLERTPLDLAKELEQGDVVTAIREVLEDDVAEERHEVPEDSVPEAQLTVNVLLGSSQ